MKTRTAAIRRFHELPLVVFAALAVAGGGFGAGQMLASTLGLVSWPPARMEAGFVALLLGGGILVSLLHLGRRRRMLHALRRTGRSALSTEVAVASVTTAAALAAFAVPLRKSAAAGLWVTLSVSAFLLLLLLARVYRLPGQLSWGGAAAPAPALMGLAFGILAQVAAGIEHRTAAIDWILLLLALDITLFAARWRRLEIKRVWGAPAHPAFFAARRLILSLRLLFVSVLPASMLPLGADDAALAILALGIVVDRFAFYALALQQTTEAEIERIEAIIKYSAG